jgi:CDP-diacylglycerol--serine O-phosphatidyltransferase
MNRPAHDEEARRTHLSMLRSFHVADDFTIANAFCGVSAIFEAMKFLGWPEVVTR